MSGTVSNSSGEGLDIVWNQLEREKELGTVTLYQIYESPNKVEMKMELEELKILQILP